VIKDVDTAIIQMLLQNGADPSISDGSGKHALDHARLLKRSKMIPLLSIAENTEDLRQRRCWFCKRIGTTALPRCSGCNEATYCAQKVGLNKLLHLVTVH
jgi:hypothetical protein